jgi:hypothetical protein
VFALAGRVGPLAQAEFLGEKIVDRLDAVDLALLDTAKRGTSISRARGIFRPTTLWRILSTRNAAVGQASWHPRAGELHADRLVEGERPERHMVTNMANGNRAGHVHLTLRAAAGAVAAIDAVLLLPSRTGCSATMLPTSRIRIRSGSCWTSTTLRCGRARCNNCRAAKLTLQDLLRPRVTKLGDTYDMGDCWERRELREAGRPTPSTAPPARLTARGFFCRDRDRGRVDGGSDVSSEPSFAVEEVNDPSEEHPAERVSRTARSSVSASTAIRGRPDVIAAHTAVSHIHAGISRDRPGWTSM